MELKRVTKKHASFYITFLLRSLTTIIWRSKYIFSA